MGRLRAAILVAIALVALPAWGESIAFVADVRGSATIEGDGRLRFLAELPVGTRVLLGSRATAAITYAVSGAEFSLSGPGRFLLKPDEVVAEDGTPPRRREVATLTDTAVVARAAQTATASLRMRGLAAPASATLLVFPVSTKVSTLRPVLRWRPAPGESYVVAVQDGAGRELWRGGGDAGDAQPEVRLAAGTRYTWTVKGSRGAAAEADFETLPEGALRRVERSRAAAKTFGDRVVHALLLEEVGARQESREAWAALARERPEMPELPALAR